MMTIDFQTDKEFSYHWCGKFVTQDPSWVHLTRHLTDFELIVMTEGSLHIADALQEYTVSEGEYLLMTPTLHQYGTKPSSCSFFWMHFGYNREQNDFGPANDERAFMPGHILIPRQGRLSSPERLMILLRQLMDSDKRYREASLNRYLCSAVLAELAAQSSPFKDSKERPTEKKLVSDIKAYINWHIEENLRITEIADYFGYNVKYLTSLFGRLSGMSLKQYALQRKMEYAGRLLTGSNLSVSQLAYRLGFQDSHNFSNAFKKIMGASPRDYRESTRPNS